MADDPAGLLVRLQGVWFPVGWAADGHLHPERQPVFPTKIGDPWVMTIRGDRFHVTAGADWYATGGRLRVDPDAGRLSFIYPELPPGWEVHNTFRLSGGELFLHCGGVVGYDAFGTSDTHYVRVAHVPTPEMTALIDEVIRCQEQAVARDTSAHQH